MTDQIEDEFLYKGEKYTLAGYSAGEPFTPHQLGIRPNMANTACWRGYQSTYGLQNGRLVVAELRFELVEDKISYSRLSGPEINGVKPLEEASGLDWFNNNYLGLNYPVTYGGGLIIGNGYNEKFHGDMDLVTLWKYREVIELQFQQGLLSEVRSLSALMHPIQQFATQKNAHLRTFMDRLGAAMKNAGSAEEREIIKRNFLDTKRNSILEQSMDDFSRETLAGQIDPVYMES